MNSRRRPFSLRPRHLLWVAAPLLLWFVLRDIPIREIGEVLARLSGWQVLTLIAVNLGVILAFSGRWWVILRYQGFAVAYLRLSVYRLAAFAVSYFTPGPHFGGEPLQVLLIHRRHGVPASAAAASIALEKAVELVANFTFLAVGVLVILRLNVLSPGLSLLLSLSSLGLLALPVVFFVSAWSGARPLTRLLGRAPARFSGSPTFSRLHTAVEEVELQLHAFCRSQPAGLALALLFSLVSWAALIGEYWLALRFLGLDPGIFGTVAAITAARLAILLPFPGALGVLEASQVLALQSLGFSASDGAAVGLLIRARDVAFGAIGLGLAWRLAGPFWRRTSRVVQTSSRRA